MKGAQQNTCGTGQAHLALYGGDFAIAGDKAANTGTIDRGHAREVEDDRALPFQPEW